MRRRCFLTADFHLLHIRCVHVEDARQGLVSLVVLQKSWQMRMMSECAFSETDVSTALVVSFAVLDEFVPLLHAASEASRNAASVSVNAFLFIITPPGIFWE